MEEAIAIPVELLDQILIATQPTIEPTVEQREIIGWNNDHQCWSVLFIVHQFFVHTPVSTIISIIAFAGSSPFCILRNAEIMITNWPELNHYEWSRNGYVCYS